MRRAYPDRPSILVSEQLMAKILPMTPEHVGHFDSLEDGFFKEGDELSDWQRATDEVSDPTAVCSPRRWSPRRRTLYGAGLGAACVLGLVLLGHARAIAPRVAEPSVQMAPPVVANAEIALPVAANADIALPAAAAPPAEMAAEAEAVAEPPPNFPAPAPVAERRTSSPLSLATGAVAANAQADALEACQKAFGRHRAKDVLATCPKAMDATPQSAELAVMLAKTELDRGRAHQALEWARKAVALDADRAEAYVYLGGAEQASGRSASAKAAYKRYLQLAPQGRYAADLRAVLTSL